MMGILPLKGRTLQVLSQEDLFQIDAAVYKVLSNPGVKLEHDEALHLFQQNGADVDMDQKMVRIPQHLIEFALKHAPKHMTVCGKEAQHDIKSFQGVHFSSGHGASHVIDFETGLKRPALKKDLENNARVHDALENTHLIYPEIYPQDVSESILDRHISHALLRSTSKPVVATAFSLNGAKDLLQMGQAISGSAQALQQRPMFTVSLGMISPFLFEPDRVDVLFEMCRFGHPFQIYTIPSAGTTSPVTLAGTLVLSLAELLSALALTQLVNPGTPVRLMGYAGSFDMRFGAFTFASPEKTLMSAALAQMLRFYGVPSGVHGSTTRANVLDAQAGYETGMLNLFSALSGADIVIECTSASLQNTATSVPEQAIICNEICHFVRRLCRGIDVNPETLAVEVMQEVGPGGEYLTHSHTLDYFQSEHWDAKLGNRMEPEKWEKQGSLDIRTKARQRYDEIFKEHHPQILRPEVEEKLEQIVAKAES